MKWDYVSSMMNRSKFGVAQVNKDIVILGGKRDKLRISSGETFKDNSLVNSWALDNIRSGFGIVVLNDELYVVGGNDGETILTTFERLSQYDNTWKRLDGLNEGRDELAVTVGRDSKIYAIGGFGGSESTCLRSVERYDTVTRRWEFTRPMQIPRRALSAVTLADGIYAIGGFDGQNYLNSVEKYDEYSNTWTMITGMK
jgi:N-acetylneuraminic acid mutarotase